MDRTLLKVFIALSLLSNSCQSAGSRSRKNGLVRYQRGDQGPDDDLQHSEITVDSETIIDTVVIPPIGGPNVCRSR